MAFSLESARLQIFKQAQHIELLQGELNKYVQKHNTMFFLMTMHGIGLSELLNKLEEKGVITSEERTTIQDAGRKVLEELRDRPAQGQNVGADGGIIGGVPGPEGKGVHNGSSTDPVKKPTGEAAPSGDSSADPIKP